MTAEANGNILMLVWLHINVMRDVFCFFLQLGR